MDNIFTSMAKTLRMVDENEPITYGRLATLFEGLADMQELNKKAELFMAGNGKVAFIETTPNCLKETPIPYHKKVKGTPSPNQPNVFEIITVGQVDEDRLRYLSEDEKKVIYDKQTNRDICSYYNEEDKAFLLNLLNLYGSNRG